jgi:peroxiredoxin
MAEVLQTLEGWYALHDFRTINWSDWRTLSDKERRASIDELSLFLNHWELIENNHQGSTAFYSILGHKADFVIVHLRPTLQELNELETAFDKSAFARHTSRTYSYVSVVELSNYVNNPGEDPMQNPEVIKRLKPIMPKTAHICFYPMNKRRQGEDNWYMLSVEQRREMMRAHGMLGRKYAGQVKQIISGSVGFDDWEWGVTLFSEDPLTFKKLVYEMRFDEASARFGEFGNFYVGNLLTTGKLEQMLEL